MNFAWIIALVRRFLPMLKQTTAEPQPAPEQYLTKQQMLWVKDLRPAYILGCTVVGGGVPWESLAAIHYRENEFGMVSRRPGGPFQLDPGGSDGELKDRITRHVHDVCQRYGQQYGSIEDNFTVACIVAADELKNKARGVIAKAGVVDGDILADAFWGYNGRASNHTESGTKDPAKAHWCYSPYVANDPKRGVILRLRGTVPDDTVPGGRRRIDIEDQRPGALIIYRELVSRAAELA